MSVPRARPPSDAAVVEGEVPFHDVDGLHIVWHGHYYKYLELARTVLFRRHRIDGQELLDTGHSLVVSRSECRHVSALTYGDRYRVKAWFLDVVHRIDVGYEIWNLTRDERAARARTELVTLTADGIMLLETPALLRARINATPWASEPR